jgi:hypothetical protein
MKYSQIGLNISDHDFSKSYIQSMVALYMDQNYSCDTNNSKFIYHILCGYLLEMNTEYTFLYENDNYYYQIVIESYNDRLINAKTLYSCADHYNDFEFPKYTFCANQTHKASTYWPNKYLLIFVFNANVMNNSNAIIATRSLHYSRYGNGWTYKSIEGSEYWKVTALFWWYKTDSVYAVIEDSRLLKRTAEYLCLMKIILNIHFCDSK